MSILKEYYIPIIEGGMSQTLSDKESRIQDIAEEIDSISDKLKDTANLIKENEKLPRMVELVMLLVAAGKLIAIAEVLEFKLDDFAKLMRNLQEEAEQWKS